MANPEMSRRENTEVQLNNISEKSRVFIRLVASSSLEEVHYSRADVLKLIKKNKLKKELNEIMTLLTELEVIPKDDERK